MAPCRVAAIGLACLVSLAMPAAASAFKPQPAAYGVSAPTQMPVTMSDGTKLTADVYVPTDPATGVAARGPFPVILAQTPYGKRGAVTTRSASTDGGAQGEHLGGDGYYPYLVQRGYINAIVDVRGTGSSQGHFELFGAREIRDGAELVRWAAHLPGSDGNVGGAGSSYLGINQILTAAAVGPRSALKAIFPIAAGSDLYRDLSFDGGIPNDEFAVVFAGLRASMITAVPDEPQQDPTQVAVNPLQRTQDYAALDGSLYSEIDTGGPRAYDNAFWAQRAPSAYLKQVVHNGVPAFLLGGWFDVYQRGEPLNFAGLQNSWAGQSDSATGPMTASQPVTGRYQLAMGPWFHNPAVLGLPLQQLQLEWFDTWLKGRPTGMAQSRRPLHIFELGPNRWFDAARYPLPGTSVRTLYLGPGSLGERRPATAGATDKVVWTGQSSPCNRGTDQWNTGLGTYVTALAGAPAPSCVNEDGSMSAGGVTYTSTPLAKPLSVAGPIGVTLYATATTRDTELVATLEDVGPDGSSYPLSSGALLGSMRAVDDAHSWKIAGRTVLPWHPFSQASHLDVVPGALTRYDLEVYPTFARLAAGHRVRLTVTSGTTGLEPTPAQAPQLAGGVYELAHGPGAPSRIELPVASSTALSASPQNYGPCNGGCRP